MASIFHIFGQALEADWVEAWDTWVGGLGTVGTLIYAIKALQHESERRRQDLDQAKLEQRKAEDRQARTVLIYERSAEAREGQPLKLKFRVGNFGDLRSPMSRAS